MVTLTPANGTVALNGTAGGPSRTTPTARAAWPSLVRSPPSTTPSTACASPRPQAYSGSAALRSRPTTSATPAPVGLSRYGPRHHRDAVPRRADDPADRPSERRPGYGPTPTVPFTVGSTTEVSPTALVVTATSSNPVLVPAANIQISGSGSARAIKVTAAPRQSARRPSTSLPRRATVPPRPTRRSRSRSCRSARSPRPPTIATASARSRA